MLKNKLTHLLFLVACTVSPTCSQTFLSWNKSPEPDVAFYRVYHNKIHLLSTALQSVPITLYGEYNVTAVDTARNESGFSESAVLSPASTPYRIRNLTVNSRGDTSVVAIGDSVIIAFELINRLEDGTVVPDSSIRYGTYFRYVGATQWFQIGALQRADQTGRQSVFLGLQPRDRIEITVHTFYNSVQSLSPAPSVFVRILPGAVWKKRSIKIIV